MKKFTPIFLALGAMAAFSTTKVAAQKNCNLGLTLVSPANNQAIPFTVTNDASTHVPVKFNIKNNGTAAIVPTDTIFFQSEFSGNVRIITGQSIAANATVLYDANIYITNAVTTETTTDYCLRLFPQKNVYYSATTTDTVWAAVTYTDSDTSNDRGCSTVIMKPAGATAVNEISKFNNQQLSLYPNPANAEVTFQLKLEKADKVIVSIKDITGREVMRNELGMVKAGLVNTFKLDVQILNNGLYIVDLLAGENKATGKLEITR